MDVGEEVVQTNDGVFVDATRSYGSSSNDLSLLKTDSKGNLEWEKTSGYTGDDYGRAIALANDAGIVIVGQIYSIGARDTDILLIKLTWLAMWCGQEHVAVQNEMALEE